MALDYGMILNQPSANQQIQQGIGQFIGIREAEAQAQQRELAQQAAQLEAARTAAFNGAFSEAYQTGNKEQLTNLIGQFPDKFEQIKQAAGFKDEQQTKALGSLGIQISNLATTDPQAAANLIAQNQDVLRNAGAGYEPEGMMQLLSQDPVALAKKADTFSLLALGPKDYYAVTGNREKIATQQRGQDITMRGQDIQQQEGAADRATRMQTAAMSAASRMQAAATAAQAGQTLGAKDIRQINSDLTSFTKEHNGMYSAAQDLTTLRERNTPASQLAAIFKYMKALDPTSVVREGEQVMVQRTDGVFGAMGNYVSQLQSGQRLNATQMADLEATAKELADSQAQTVNSSIDNYLSSYGETIPASQRKLLESRKAKTFGEQSAPDTATGAPQVGSVVDGYTFKGGDPADPASWEQK